MSETKERLAEQDLSKQEFINEVLSDYKIAFQSRQASLIGRKEVLTGKAKFGIFGDGKEVAQLAMAKAFKKGDFRSGYYRDQTFMFATGMSNVKAFFAQLYANPSLEAEPSSAGRSMNGHFGSRMLDENGNWLPQTDKYNSSADISPTAGQMPRLVGLAFASKLYRQNEALHGFEDFSIKGNEVAFGTIGNASTSEGPFWESINAAGVLQVPMAVSIWDDEYGISVPAKYQTTKENLSSILSGFQTDENGKGYEIFKVRGWDYPELVKTYQKAINHCRENHNPVIIHVVEMTQPQGHSTSGSHERYKSKERLQWETDFDCIKKMREWILSTELSSEADLDTLEKEAIDEVKTWKREAWKDFSSIIKTELNETLSYLESLANASQNSEAIQEVVKELKSTMDPMRKDIGVAIVKALRLTVKESLPERSSLVSHYRAFKDLNYDRYSSHLHSQSSEKALNVAVVPAEIDDNSESLNGFEILQKCFDHHLATNPKVFAFGEDVGKIGDVNQGFAGLQEKHGELKVMDAGIRELTIVGQAIGASMRGLRPIAEIQYLDYLLYAIQIMSDDISTLQYRTKGGQKAPLIIRTRGHRLEGIWHSGSPMGMIINALRGMNVLVPRNMVQAAGFYNTMLQSDEPALIVECLNGYRLKETVPNNLTEFTVPLGQPETLREGTDCTIVTYGSCCRVAEQACQDLAAAGIEVELIDVQTLVPFDVDHHIAQSLAKTNRLLVLDEDVPGGASAYILQKIVEEQNGYFHLDSQPITLSAMPHRPAYGSDGDYFSKPNPDDIFQAVYGLMHESNPTQYPEFLA